MNKTKRRILSILLTLALVLGLIPGVSLTAYAYDGNPYASLVNQTTDVTFDGKTWYIIEDNSTAVNAGTVTLLAKKCVASSKYNASGSFVGYDSNPTVKTAVDNWYTGNITADAKKAVSGGAMFLLTKEEANAITNAEVRKDGTAGAGWWLCSQGNSGAKAVFVNGGTGAVFANGGFVEGSRGVRPALKLNLSSVIFSSESKTFSLIAAGYNVTITAGSNMTKTETSGAASQTGLSGAMTDVVYTANDGYYFPTDYSVTSVKGISVTRNSYTQITVSGTPTADAAIALTAPTAKTTPDAPTTAAAVNCATASNNDGKLTGVTADMEYKKSDATVWTAGTGSDITGLVPGTYYVRVKATDTTNASTNQELTIKGFISYTVTFKVVNGKWNEGEGDAATEDKTVTLTGHDGDTLKLTADQIPAVGSKPNDTYKAGSWDVTPSADTAITTDTTYTYTYAQKSGISQTVTFKVVNGAWNDEATTDKTVTLTGYEGDTLKLAATDIPAVGSKPNDTYKAGSWDVTPSTDTAITEATTYTYTYVAKEASVVTKAPEAKTLTYNGQEQALVTAGEATGGEMQYALGNATEATQPYTTSIPTATNAGTYYVWYKVKGDDNHDDTKAASVKVSIAKRRVTLTSGTATKVYDGKALKNNKVTVSGDGWAKGEGATYKVTGSQTKVGKSNNKFSYTLKSGTDAKNYNIVTKTGTLTVTEPVVRGTFIHIKSIAQKNNKLQINWTKVGQADGYDVYVQYCTKNFADPVKTIKKNATTQLTIAKLNGKKIDLTKAFKIYVVAYKMVNGKKTVLAKTVTSHVAGVNNAKYTNQKALKLTKSTFDIKAGKTAKIKVSATLVDGKKKIIPKDHGAAFKFRSSNTRVATVDKDGKITAKKTGKCYIFVYGISGLMKKVTVTVK